MAGKITNIWQAISGFLCLVGYLGAAYAQEPKHVLLLNSYHPGLTWSDNETAGIRSTFAKTPGLHIELHIEYLDAKRTDPSPSYFEQLRRLFALKYAGQSFAAIMCTDDDALLFLLEYRDQLFPGVPVVYCGVGRANQARLASVKHITGIFDDAELKANLELALTILPRTKQAVFIHDQSATGKASANEVRTLIPQFPNLEFTFLTNLNVRELQAQVRRLPPTAVLFPLVFNRDHTGHVYTHEEFGDLIGLACPVPMIGSKDYYLGHGAIGGAMVTGEAQGVAAANLVRQMLEGSGNRDLPFPPESTVRYLFDFPLLQRHKIPVSALPAGSVLLRQPQSYFAKNESLILSATAVIGCLAAGVVVLSLAILRRHRVEFILREREERLQLALEGSSDGFFDRNVVTGAAQFSPRWLEMLGYSLGDISPHLRAWEKLIHPDDKPMVMRALDDHLAGRTPQYAAEHRLRTKSGEWKWILARGKVVARDQAGRPLRIAGTHVDITERKQSEKKLREQAALLDKAQDAILVTDLDQQLLFWNKSAEHLYGWTADEVQHRKIQELLFPKDASNLSEAVAVVREKGEWMGEMTQITRQGQAVLVQSRWTLVRDESGQSQKIMVVNTDFTEHKKLETKLLRAQRLESIGTLASGIAHDLNNVLSPILMAVQYLRERAPDEECQSMLAILESSAQRGADIVKQVLTFARGIEGERILLQPKHLLKEMVKIAQETFPKDIEVTAQYAPRLWVIKGDPTQLHQVLLNLCLNARDAMPDGGKLSLIAENIDLDSYYAQMTPDAKAGPYVVLTVTDTGHGIPDELLDKIFEPFFTTKAVGKGTGLGLATALGIVKSHGGFMHVYSVRGKGSQFKVHLPATRTDQADAAQIIPVAPPRGQGELVLVVDDEAPIRQITCRTLKENGYQVITANDGAEAVAVYAQNAAKIIVVLTDMIMPFMDGAATIRALHRINPEVRIIVASGMLTHKREAEAIGPGVRAFLSKPFTAEKLVSCLHEVLTRK